MIVYHVTVTVNAEIETNWSAWMSQVHIPEVLRTGCFLDCRMHRVIDSAAIDPTFVMFYRCQTLEDFQRYQRDHAPSLQKDHADRYEGRVRAGRQILEELGHFSSLT